MKVIPTAEFERLRTFLPEIAAALLPPGTKWRDEGPRRRYFGMGGFAIDLRAGWWWSFAKNAGGFSPVGLVKFLKECGTKIAIEYLLAFLDSHEGVGSCITDSGDD